MPYILNNNTTTAGIAAVVAVDDDDQIKLWTTLGGYGNAAGIRQGVNVALGGPVTFNSAASHQYFQTASGDVTGSKDIVTIATSVPLTRTGGYGVMAIMAGCGAGDSATDALYANIQSAANGTNYSGLGRKGSGATPAYDVAYLTGGSYDGLGGAGYADSTAAKEAWAIAFNGSTGTNSVRLYRREDGGTGAFGGTGGTFGGLSTSYFTAIGGCGKQSDGSALTTYQSGGKFLCVVVWDTNPAVSLDTTIFDAISTDWLGALFSVGSGATVIPAASHLSRMRD